MYSCEVLTDPVLNSHHPTQGKRTSVRYWSSCDVPFTVDNVTALPEVCFPYRAGIGLNFIDKLEGTLAEVVEDLKGGIEVVFAYTCGIDEYGHLFGPESNLIKNGVMRTDAYLSALLTNLENEGGISIPSNLFRSIFCPLLGSFWAPFQSFLMKSLPVKGVHAIYNICS